MFFFVRSGMFFSFGRAPFFRALGCGARRTGASARIGASDMPAEVTGACSGRSKSSNLACNHAVAFRPAGAKQAHGKPTNSYRGENQLHLYPQQLYNSGTPHTPDCLHSWHGVRPILPASVRLAALDANSVVVSLV